MSDVIIVTSGVGQPGRKGDTGEIGPKGDKGDKGDTGVGATNDEIANFLVEEGPTKTEFDKKLNSDSNLSDVTNKSKSRKNLDAAPSIWATKYVPDGVDVSVTDVTTYVQQVFDEAAMSGVECEIRLPVGLTRAEPTIKSNVKIVGSSLGRSTFDAIPGSTRKGVLTLDQTGGPITRITLDNVAISGDPANPNQWGIYVKTPPRVTSPYDSGLWYSKFSNVRITNTLGGGVWLNGGGVDSLGPIQFLNWDNVSLQVTSGTAPNWIGLLISGQVGQVNFDQVEMSYRGTGRGSRALYIAREMDADKNNVSDRWGYALNFNACTFQGCSLGIQIDRAQAVNFNACWIEDNDSGFQVGQSAKAVTFNTCAFADTGHNSTNTGFVGKVTDIAAVVVINPTVIGVLDNLWSQDAATACSIEVIGDQNAATRPLIGYPKNMPATGTMVVGSNRYIGITGAATIDTISSTADNGSIIFIRALTAITINPSTGNIRFPTGWGTASRTFASGSRIGLIYDKGGNIVTIFSYTGPVQLAGAIDIVGSAGAGYLTLPIQSVTPASPTAGPRLFARLNGSSKVETCIVYPSGTVQIIHTEP